jgi:hypothetical protein
MTVLIGGLLLGLVFLLTGLSGAFGRLRLGMQSLLLRRRGVNLQAEILSRRRADNDSATSQLITGQWLWGEAEYKEDFTVPDQWLAERGGTLTIPVRIDPMRPHVAVIEPGSRHPALDLLIAVVWLIMAAVGVFFLLRTVPIACDYAQYDEMVRPLCEAVVGTIS